MSTVGAFGEGLSALGNAGTRLALVLKEYNDKWDAARAMEAQNEFNRSMTDWLDNSETGQTVACAIRLDDEYPRSNISSVFPILEMRLL
ncbi:hypothetical protein AGMMS50276_02780 [Synergistales bacterium]|nr:hypothetical protein AGMMS50276_02780 [Synergistales bacterium]